MFALSQASTYGLEGTRLAARIAGFRECEPPLPLAEIFDRTGVAPDNALPFEHCYYTNPAFETARNAETGFAIKSMTSGLFCCGLNPPILPSSQASAYLGEKAGATPLPKEV
jgi:hypothetical protein